MSFINGAHIGRRIAVAYIATVVVQDAIGNANAIPAKESVPT